MIGLGSWKERTTHEPAFFQTFGEETRGERFVEEEKNSPLLGLSLLFSHINLGLGLAPTREGQ